ncbi:protein NRT1/ PTR FAMILY 3.1-like [Panicum miliaceum]|uniref:Protein NRT1/ PTR FAMILY 3.1-like n=1 Tax=Panicum miliaceum TaxID=4540 RepID=A0A3L6SV33_PANMI|nr:protein NRT1/ PTR FAMILY 3.1-like [Panicum miliaceum]
MALDKKGKPRGAPRGKKVKGKERSAAVIWIAGKISSARLQEWNCVLQVVVAAFRKRKVDVPEDAGLLYHNKELDAPIADDGRLLHTDLLRQVYHCAFLLVELLVHVHRCGFLDRAAVLTTGDLADSGEPHLWRVSTVHRVEELKSIVRMLPLWAASITLIAAASHNFTFPIQQARTMDRHLTPSFQIPPATMIIFTTLTMLVSLALYDRAFVPLARRYTGRRSGITYFQRMGAGFAVSVLGAMAGALVETRRRGVAAEHGLLYALHCMSDALSTVGHMEFLYDQSPESMRSSAAALFWDAGSLGNYLGTVLVTVVQSASGGVWLQDNFNRGRLDYYYWLVTFLLVLNLVYYIACFHFYTLRTFGVVVVGSKVENGMQSPATTRACPNSVGSYGHDFCENYGLVYDPMVSPHYEVFLVPIVPATLGFNSKFNEDLGWPSSPYTMHVLSSRNWRWEERSFTRERGSCRNNC